MSFRKQWEPVLEKIAKRLAFDEIDVLSQGQVTAHHFYCTTVMDVARHLRQFTRAKDEQGQHDVLKILLKYYRYGRRGKFEIKHGRYRLDIAVDDGRLVISVKTIVDVTVEKVQEKASMVLSLKQEKKYSADRVWIAYFYKFKGQASPKKACKYLLCWIDIDISGVVDVQTLNQDLIAMVQKTKTAVAGKLGVDDKIIIPVDNIMLVEELERESKEKDDLLGAKDELLEAKDDVIDKLEQEKAEQGRAIIEKAKTIDEQTKTIDEQTKTIDEQTKTIDEQTKTIDEQTKTIDEQTKTIADLKKRIGMK
nr:hypothetical protein [Candidatus Sigynarchaeota archaeon]